MSTDYTKSYRFWRLTFSVSLPEWMKLLTPWLFHPVATIQELHRLRRQRLLEEKWNQLFSDAFKNRPAPEFEFDEKVPGRVVRLKETPSEAKLPSVGVWSADNDHPAMDHSLSRAIKSSGIPIKMEAADEATVERRWELRKAVQNEIWEEERERAAARRRKRDLR